MCVLVSKQINKKTKMEKKGICLQRPMSNHDLPYIVLLFFLVKHYPVESYLYSAKRKNNKFISL